MKKYCHVVLILILILVPTLTGCGGGGGGGKLPQTGGATITVNDGVGPIEGVSVTLAGGTQTTDSQGRVVFNNVPVGIHTATVVKTGYANDSVDITIVGGETATATVTLSQQFGGATITVNDGTNLISGATVTLNGQTETTNSEGQAAFNNVAVGNHMVTAAKDGYGGGSANITILNGETATATVTLSQHFGGATITVNDGASPIENANVTLNGQTKTTNADGQATFSNVPVGDHTVMAGKTGYTGTSVDVTITNGSTATASVSLTRQTGNATIIVKEGSDLISGATVTLNGETRTTNTQGEAAFTGVPTGDYDALASKDGFINSTAPVKVSHAATATVTISLSPLTGSATIIVNDGTNPISGASVTVGKKTLTTNAQGVAAFSSVPVRDYLVYAVADGYDQNHAPITVNNGETAIATISLIRQKGSVTVWVKDNFNHANLNGATVTMAERTVTTVNGRADFINVPTGTYTATASCASYATAMLQVSAVNGGVVDPSDNGAYKIFLSRFVADQIVITMRDKNGNPVSDVTVTIHPKDVQSDTRTGTTNASGQVALNNVLAGVWRILASSSQPGYYIPYGMDFTVTATDVVYSFSVPSWPWP